MKIGIIGLGLIGGSLAKSVKARTLHSVAAYDIDHETMMLARMSGAIDETLTDELLPQCDLILLALRPGTAIQWVQQHGQHISPGAILVDTCGVKRVVCAGIGPLALKYGFTYIGGHPMAGKETGGFVNATGDLFSGASMILTTDEKTDISALERLKDFFCDIGFATLTFATAEEHDRIIAYTSQLAHITSSAYVKSPDARLRRGFSAGSFNDMTRVARLDEHMWTELFMDNSDFLGEQLEILIEHLQQYHQALKDGDAQRLCTLLKEGKDKKLAAGGY